MITIKSLIYKLNNYKFSHPNYYYIWYNYIYNQIKKYDLKNFKNIDIEIDNLISYLKNNQDISEKELIAYLFTIQF